MDILWLVLFIALLIVAGLACLTYWMTKQFVRDSEKSSPYECGFNPFSSARSPFSIRFYMYALLFLVFEVETLLLYPVFQSWVEGGLESNWYAWMFLGILTFGLLFEMYKGALTWSRE